MVENVKPRLQILIVDAENEIRELLGDYLRHHLEGELQIHEAIDGQEGLQKIGRQKFDLVISDIRMPRMDGMDLLKSIVKLVENRFHPEQILVLSAHVPSEKHNTTSGKVTYMIKPPFNHELRGYLARVFPQNFNLENQKTG